MLLTSDIRPHVEAVLLNANNCLSAYQILERLPAEIRDQLILERGWPGVGGGHPHSAATLVTQTAVSIIPSNDPPHRTYMDSVGITFRVAGRESQAGNSAIAMYRLRADTEVEKPDVSEETA